MLLEVKLPYDPVCPSVGWSNGLFACTPVGLSFSWCQFPNIAGKFTFMLLSKHLFKCQLRILIMT